MAINSGALRAYTPMTGVAALLVSAAVAIAAPTATATQSVRPAARISETAARVAETTAPGTVPERRMLADLDVDTNRDGSVDDVEDEAGEDTVTAERGALYAVGCESARKPPSSTGPDALARLVARLPATPGSWFLRMSATDARALRLFRASRQDDSWVEILPTAATKTAAEGTVPDKTMIFALEGMGELDLAIEGRVFAGQPLGEPLQGEVFDGVVDIELVRGMSLETADRVRVHVAPFLVLPPTHVARRIWIQGNESSAKIAAALGNESTRVEEVRQDAVGAASHRFFQDHLEIGFTAIPAGDRAAGHHIALRTPLSPLPLWPATELPGPTRCVVSWNPPHLSFGSNPADMGGNIGLIPPAPGRSMGRVLMGSGMSRDFLAFFRAQTLAGKAAQAPVVVDTDWLRVGHVDEIVNFLPAPGREARERLPFKIVVASPAYALHVLREGDHARNIPAPADTAALFTTGRQTSGRASNAIETQSRVLLFDGVAHGRVRCVHATDLRDGESLTAGDGRRRLRFELDFDGEIARGSIGVALDRDDFAVDVCRKLGKAITRELDLVIALKEPEGAMILAAEDFGTEANEPLEETVAVERFKVDGMRGGEPESEGRDFREGDWRVARIYRGKGAGQVAAVSERGRGYFSVYTPRRPNAVFHTTSRTVGEEGREARGLYHLLNGELRPDENGPRWLVEPDRTSEYLLAEESLTWRTRGPTGTYGFPTMTSAAELREDQALARLNEEAERRIAGVKTALRRALGEALVRDDQNPSDDSLTGDDDDDFIRVPVLFFGRLSESGAIEPQTGEALTPNLVNFQSSGPNGHVFPRTHFGPAVEVAGHDPFEWTVRQAVGEAARFVDEWWTYHDRAGELHCATIVEREPFETPWWQSLPSSR